MHLDLWFSSGISCTAPMWIHFEIFTSYVLCSFDCMEHPLPALGKHLCTRNVLHAETIAAGRGIQSEQKLDHDWMRSWKEIDLDKYPGAETRSRRGGKRRVGQGQGRQRMRTAAVNAALKMIDSVSASTRALLYDVRQITWTTGGHQVLFLCLVFGLRAWGLICRSS